MYPLTILIMNHFYTILRIDILGFNQKSEGSLLDHPSLILEFCWCSCLRNTNPITLTYDTFRWREFTSSPQFKSVASLHSGWSKASRRPPSCSRWCWWSWLWWGKVWISYSAKESYKYWMIYFLHLKDTIDWMMKKHCNRSLLFVNLLWEDAKKTFKT